MLKFKPEPETPASSGRRQVLREGGKWLGTALGLAMLYPLLKFIGFDIPRKPRKIRVENDLLPGGFYIGREFIIFSGAHGQIWAVSRKCTHLGCLVSYNETAKQLICPCHQSRFSKQGKRLAGPAKLNLPVYKVAKAGKGRTGYVVTI